MTTKSKTVRRLYSMPSSVAELIDRLARDMGVSRSELIRLAIKKLEEETRCGR